MEKEELIKLLKDGTKTNIEALKILENANLEKYNLKSLYKILEILGTFTEKCIQEIIEIIMKEEGIERQVKNITKIVINTKNKTDKEIRKEIEQKLKENLPPEIVNDILKSL